GSTGGSADKFSEGPFFYSEKPSAPAPPAAVPPVRSPPVHREILPEILCSYILLLYFSQCSSSSRSACSSSPSGTFLTISPFLISRPSPLPPAIPISASFASPGPLTTHPITATVRSSGNSCTMVST